MPTRFPVPQSSAVTASPALAIPWPWIALADCESGDGPKAAGPPYHPDWRYHDATYDGGLNFEYATWDDAWAHALAIGLVSTSGKKLAGPALDAWQHPARVQVDVAIAWQKFTSWDQWPACSRIVGVS